MTFLWPTMLGTLVLIPALLALYGVAMRRRRRTAAAYGSFGLAQSAAGRTLGARRHMPPALFLLGLTILLIGLARPEATVSMPRQEGTIILAFDISRSMSAADIEPSRLEVAKAAARTFVERQPSGVQIGVVAFSESGFATQLPTTDHTDILAAIDRLQPQLGTSLGQGLLTALNAIAVDNGKRVPAAADAEVPPTPAIIVLFSDGDDLGEPSPLEVAQLAAARDVLIYTVGLGSPAGAPLEIDGFTLHTVLNEQQLQQIAEAAEGSYFNAADQEDLSAIYERVKTQLVVRNEKTEVTAIFAGAGLLVLLLGSLSSMLWLNRAP